MRFLGQMGFLMLALSIVGLSIDPAIAQDKKEDKKEEAKDKKSEVKKEDVKDKKPEVKKEDVKDKKEVGKVKGQLPAYWKNIGISDDQKQNVYKIQSKYRSKIDEHQSEIAKLKTEEKKELEKVLTEDQKKKLVEAVTGSKSDK